MNVSITSINSPPNIAPPVSLEHAIEQFLNDLPAETARSIRLASGIDTPAPRAIYSQSRQVPALLLDTRLRFELERDIQDFIDSLNPDAPSVSGVTTLSWQLQLLGLELLWPATCVLQVYDPPSGRAAAEYGPDLSPTLPRVRITRTEVLEGRLWNGVLQQMSPTQRAALLDGQYITFDAQLSALKRKAASQLSSRRAKLFDNLHAFRQQSRDPLVNLLRNRIPALPLSAAKELLVNSTEADRQALELSEGELNESQWLAAYWYLQQDRLNQAYEGLFLESRQHNHDTHLLLLHSLATLPGWPSSDVRLELRNQTSDGRLITRVGDPQATQIHIILRRNTGFTLHTAEGPTPESTPDLLTVLAGLPDTLRNPLGLTDRPAIQRLLRQHPPLPRAHLHALLGFAPLDSSSPLPADNGYLQDSPTDFVSPDQLAQKQRHTFDALAATNERTLLLASQLPNFRWFAGLIMLRQLKRDFPQATATSPDAIFLNTFDEVLYWPLSESGERGEQVRYRAVKRSQTLTEVFIQRLAGNPQTFDPATSGFYASATAAYDEDQLPGLDLKRLDKTLEDASIGFETRFTEQLDNWSAGAELLRENLRTQIRLEAQLRELDLSLDENNRKDLERVLEEPAFAQRQKKYPIDGPIHVYRIALQPTGTVLEGCLIITRSPDEDIYKLPALLYQIGRGLEQFTTLQTLKRSLTHRLDDEVERTSLLELLPRDQRTWSPVSAADRTELFTCQVELDDPFQVLVNGLFAKHKKEFTDTWRFARGAPGLESDVAEFVKQLDSTNSLTRLLDIVPVLKRRNQDLMFSDLLKQINDLKPAEQTQLANLWKSALKTNPVPGSLGDLPALKAHAANLLKTHLQRLYPQASIDPDNTEVHVTHITTLPSPAWQSQPLIHVPRHRSVSLTALALENIPGSRMGETVNFKAQVSDPAGTLLSLSDAEVKAIVRAVDAPGSYRTLLKQELLGPDSASLRTAWLEGQRAQMRLHAYVARLSGDFLDSRSSDLERGYRRIEHLLKYPSAQNRPPVDGSSIQANYLMLGSTRHGRNGMSIDEVLVISTNDPADSLILYTPQAPDGKTLRELKNISAIEALLREQSWQNYFTQRAARNEQWNPADLFARQFPQVRYFPIEGDLFTALYEARAKHLISSVEYFGASNERVDRETLWYWINVGLRFAVEAIVGMAPLQISLPFYVLRGLYGLANVSQALAVGHHHEAADALVQTLLDAAAPLPLQPIKPILRQIQPLRLTKISRLVKSSRIGQGGLRQTLLVAEPSAAMPLRTLAADLKSYEIVTPPELNYFRDGLFIDRTGRDNLYVNLEGKWYRTGSRNNKRYLLKKDSWSEDIELVRVGKHWQPLPRGRLLGGAPDPVGTARYEIEATYQRALEERIRVYTRRLDPEFLSPYISSLEQQAKTQLSARSNRLAQDARHFFNNNPVSVAKSLAPDLLDAVSATQLIERGYHTQNGVVLSASSSSKGGRQLLIDNMQSLARENAIKTLYLEDLLRDFDQVHLNNFHRTGVMPQRLRDALRQLDELHDIDPQGPHSLYELIRRAQANGIHVQALDCAASYRQDLRRYTPDRARTLKYYGRQVIETDQLQRGPHRWIALVQDSHAGSVAGEPGLADLLGTVNLRVVDVGGQPLPVRVLPDPGETLQGRVQSELYYVHADAKLEVNVAQEALPPRPARSHRELLQIPRDFLVEQSADQYRIVYKPPFAAPREMPVVRTQLGGGPEVFHIDDAAGGGIRGVQFKSIDDLIWGLKQGGMKQVAELGNVTYLRQPKLDTHPQLSRAGMFIVETSPQGPVLIHRSRDRSLSTTVIRTHRETGKFYINHAKWGFDESRSFNSIDDLSQTLVGEIGLERVAESTDL